MQVFVPRETDAAERRAALVPATVQKLVKLGAGVDVEAGLGRGLPVEDAAYEAAGARVRTDRDAALEGADLVIRLRPPDAAEAAKQKRGALHLGYLDPFRRGDLVAAFAAAGVTAISMEMIPRTTHRPEDGRAQLAGQPRRLRGGDPRRGARCDKILPMMMTPAGTIAPARVFIIGAGVAGLQAIATAKRLGARVEAFDTRPVVEEQVQSLGARFVKVDLGETGQTKDGYAKALTEEQLEKQREAHGQALRAAPTSSSPPPRSSAARRRVIVTADMVAGMKPGSVVVDLAVETGGNVEGSQLDEEVRRQRRHASSGSATCRAAWPLDASQMYSSNLVNLVEHFWDKEAKTLQPATGRTKSCRAAWSRTTARSCNETISER